MWIEGTTGSGYMALSPKRVRLMEAASTRGGSVYAALCEEQQRVIQSTVGIRRVFRAVEREYRVETRTYYVRPVYFSPPPPPVCVYPANVVYGYGGGLPVLCLRGLRRVARPLSVLPGTGRIRLLSWAIWRALFRSLLQETQVKHSVSGCKGWPDFTGRRWLPD